MSGTVRQAVIMVGGKGTRLRPLTDTCPKPILPVLDRPCLSYLIDSLVEGGIEHIILACGYRSEQITDAIGDGSDRGIVIEYSYEDRPMGTAGAIKMLEHRLDDVFIAANGDVFADIDVRKEIEEHFATGACITVALTPVENPCEFGIARTDDKGRITEFKEKPRPEEVFSNLINAGVYVLNKKILKLVPEGEMYDLSKELIIRLMADGRYIHGHMTKGLWRDVGRPSDLLGVNLIMASRRPVTGSEGSKIVAPFYMGDGAVLSDSDVSGAVLSMNSIVKNSTLKDSLIMSSSAITDSTIENTIIGKGCVIDGSTIRDSVIGDGIVIKNEDVAGDGRK